MESRLTSYPKALILFGFLIFSITGFATNPDKPEVGIIKKSAINIGELMMTVDFVEKTDAEGAFGTGEMYVPMLDQTLAVSFKNLKKNDSNQIESGTVVADIDQNWLQSFGFDHLDNAKFESVESALSFLEKGEDRTALPIRVDDMPAYAEMDFGKKRKMLLTKLIFEKSGTTASVMTLEQTPEDAFLPFAGNGLQVQNEKIEFCAASLFLTTDTANPDFQLPLKFLSHDPTSSEENGTRIELDCSGFVQFRIEAQYEFSRDKLLPVTVENVPAVGTTPATTKNVIPKDDTKVTARMTAFGEKVNQFIASVTITPFAVAGLEDVVFTIEDAGIDYNDAENIDGLDFPSDYFSATTGSTTTSTTTTSSSTTTPVAGTFTGLKTGDNLNWKGFFMRKASISLPSEFNFAKAGESTTVSIEDLIYDKGNGATLTAAADGIGAEGAVANWKMTLDKVELKLKKNSFENFQFEGGISIPLIKEPAEATNALTYIGKLNGTKSPTTQGTTGSTPSTGSTSGTTTGATSSPKASLELKFTPNAVFSMPFLGEVGAKADLKMAANSIAGIRSINGKYEPYANLNGEIILGLKDPVEFDYSFTFEELTINDIKNAATQTRNDARRGLESLSMKAGNTAPPTPATTTAATGSSTTSPPPSLQPTSNTSTSVANPKVKGFPIVVGGINFSSVDAGYKLGFTVEVNLASSGSSTTTSGSKTVSASGTFGIIADLNMGKLTSEPWNALEFKDFAIDKLCVTSDLGAVSVCGELKFLKDDPDYGDGFQAEINLTVQTGVKFEAAGKIMFGEKEEAGTSFRYFYIYGKVSAGTGIAIPATPISIYGFGGGMYYNMDKKATPAAAATDTPAATATAAATDTPAATTNCTCSATGEGLNMPAYIPSKGTLGFIASIDLGLTGPPGKLQFYSKNTLKVSLGIANWNLKTISFEGKVYMMRSKPTDKLEDAPAQASLLIDFDNTNKVLAAALDINLAFPKESPVVNANAKVRMMFDLKEVEGDSDRPWYVWIGTPKSNATAVPPQPGPVTVSLADAFNLSAYFMIGNTPMPSLVPLTEVSPKFAATTNAAGEAINPLVDERAAISNSTDGTSIAFGAQVNFPRQDFTFLAFRAGLEAILGFDGKLSKPTVPENCPTVGINGWYFEGRAYAAFAGNLDLYIDTWFHEGSVTIFQIETKAFFQLKGPNPVYFQAYADGEYKALGGAISGDFNFEIEYAENVDAKCKTTASVPNPIAGIDIISDIDPDGGKIEVFDDLAAAFNFEMDKVIDFTVTNSAGVDVKKYFKCSVEKNELKGNGAVVALTRTISTDKHYATFSPNTALKEKTDYNFEITAGCYQTDENGSLLGGKADKNKQTKSVSFKTKDRPEEVFDAMIYQQSPGKDQHFYYKNYNDPMIILNKPGFEYLFEDKINGVTYEYKFRLTEVTGKGTSLVKGKEIGVYNLSGKPGDQLSYQSYFWRLSTWYSQTTISKKIEFRELNEIPLKKQQRYLLEILRVPPGTKSSIVKSSASSNIARNSVDKTSDSDYTSSGNSVNIQNRGLSRSSSSATQLKIKVLAKVEFGTSKYTDIADKIKNFDGNKASNPSPNGIRTNAGINFADYNLITKNEWRHQIVFGEQKGEQFDIYDFQKLHYYFSDQRLVNSPPILTKLKSKVISWKGRNRTMLSISKELISGFYTGGNITYKEYLYYINLTGISDMDQFVKMATPTAIQNGRPYERGYANIYLYGYTRRMTEMNRRLAKLLVEKWTKKVAVTKSQEYGCNFFGFNCSTRQVFSHNASNPEFTKRKAFYDLWKSGGANYNASTNTTGWNVFQFKSNQDFGTGKKFKIKVNSGVLSNGGLKDWLKECRYDNRN